MSAPTAEQRHAATCRPDGRPVMYQQWHDLLFLHWRIAPDFIQKALPEGLHVDTFDGDAWLGVVPFRMLNVRPRGLPTVPGLSNFLELNLRTYVHDDGGNPGVWFYSLDASQWLAVKIARWLFHLPYHYARMSYERKAQTSTYTCRRGNSALQRYAFTIESEPKPAQADSLEYFLAERYVLFAWSGHKRQLYAGRVHHTPYPLCTVSDFRYETTLFQLNGFEEPKEKPDHVIASPGVSVDIFALEKATAPRR